MNSSSRKIRVSLRRTISLIIISCVSCLLFLQTIVEFNINATQNEYPPTRSAGLMLNRSQMLLSKQVLLEPLLYPCQLQSNSSIQYPLYIIVKTRAVSSGIYFQRRMFTRNSWGYDARSLGIPVIYAVGKAKDERTQKMLEYESQIYKDIVQFNYIDAYYNITIKAVGILNWFTKCNCHHRSSYLLTVDDDVLINIPSLLKMISKNTFQMNTLYGLHLKDIEPHPSGKWAVSLDDYPNQTYPEFITGASTLYPSVVIHKIVEELFLMINRNQSLLFLEDVLISGLIADKLGIHRAPLNGIEHCSYTDLYSRVIISECNYIRRRYIWSKFHLSRLGKNTVEIDNLISKTIFNEWNGNFKQTRNGTAIISTNNLLLILIQNSYCKILFLILLGIFLWKFIRSRQSYINLISSKTSSTILFVYVK